MSEEKLITDKSGTLAWSVLAGEMESAFSSAKCPDVQEIEGLRLELTCNACPEQYEVFDGENEVAYFRLRHGYFYASVPGCGGKVVYSANPKGDGIFEDDERQHYLTEAVDAVISHYKTGE